MTIASTNIGRLLKKSSQVNFDYRDVARGGDVDAGKGKLYPIEISYNVTNVGPNMAHRPKVTKLVLTFINLVPRCT